MSAKADVIPIHGADWPSEQVLRKAAEKDFTGVVVIGWLKEPEDGKRFYVASSYGSADDVIYALQHANLFVLEHSREQ